jgi:hypothetical protein
MRRLVIAFGLGTLAWLGWRQLQVSSQAATKDLIAELRALRAEVARIAPATAAEMSRSLNGMARGVVTR